MHFILLKYIHNIIRYMCFYKNWLNLPRTPLLCNLTLQILSQKTKRRNRCRFNLDKLKDESVRNRYEQEIQNNSFS